MPTSLHRVTLQKRVGLVAVIAGVLLVLIGFATGSRYLEARDTGTEIVDQLEPAAANASKLLLSTADMERGVRTYVATTKAASLAPYSEGAAVSEDAIANLQELLAGTDPRLEEQVSAVEQARLEWINTIAEPAIDLVRANRSNAAEALMDSPESVRTFELLRARATAINTQIDARLSEQFVAFGNFATQLGLALVGSWVTIAIGVLAVLLLLRRWVLRPLNQLGMQLRLVAGDAGYGGEHTSRIVPTGPPEIAGVGQDAEDMRRRLNAEIEKVKRQDQTIKADSPVSYAIRAELAREPRAYAVGLDIYGRQESAESVLSGDWWDAISLPDGRTAIIITDISGHGPAAGIAGLRLKLELTGMLEAGSELAPAFSRAVRLFADSNGRYATAAAVVLDPQTRTVEWVNAGHLPPLILHPDSSTEELAITGPILSTLGGTWTSRTAAVADDDLVLLWTDGITESRDATGDELEVTGLLEFVANARRRGAHDPEQLVHRVLGDGRGRAVNWEADDRTFIVARFTA